MAAGKYNFLEFFAGGGMARLGLGAQWRCIFANDNSRKKASAYRDNFENSQELLIDDIANVTPWHIPGYPHLAWASFPCQDLSLAGSGAGLKGARSSTFWEFWRIVRQLGDEGRAPDLIVVENVCGVLTSHQGRDFNEIAKAMVSEGYRFGALVINAALFVPQSRPRLFIVACRDSINIPSALVSSLNSDQVWYTKALKRAYWGLPETIRSRWIWWKIPKPARRTSTLIDLIDLVPDGVVWDSDKKTRNLINIMSRINLSKVEAATKLGVLQVGTIYKRTRAGRQRAEVRFDGISGCLRTPAGGSSRQTLLFVEGRNIRSRLLSPREAARLMGVQDKYLLPKKYNEAYHLMGDGLVVPVVSWLEKHLLRCLCARNEGNLEAA